MIERLDDFCRLLSFHADERLLAVPLPWTRMRLVYALLRLCNKRGNGRIHGGAFMLRLFLLRVETIAVAATAQPPAAAHPGAGCARGETGKL
ncbi:MULTISPECIES: hypothetical protein [Sorangium]|uniref:hypothetical protein n=1 Tax=Sorangium TaxID=39643 RepID=UPI00101A2A9D|nr:MULTISPECIES: hypothetical protein [Sorangium]